MRSPERDSGALASRTTNAAISGRTRGLSAPSDGKASDRPSRFVVLVSEDGRCGCCRGVGDHLCGHECDSCDGSGRNPDSSVCTLPHGGDCTCVADRGALEGASRDAEGEPRRWGVGWRDATGALRKGVLRCASEAMARRFAASKPDRVLVSRGGGPWEPAGQLATPRSWSMIDSAEDLPARVAVEGHGTWRLNRGTDVYVCDAEERGFYSHADLRELGRVTEVLS